MRLALLSVVAATVLATACSSSSEPKTGNGEENVEGEEFKPSTAAALDSKMPASGTIDLTLTADKGAASDDVVSLGVPFPQGVFKNENMITVLDDGGAAVPITTKTLAKWPNDGSIRSVLVAFKATLASGKTAKWKLEYGKAPRGGDAGELTANPDGPVLATLTAEHYAASLVSGVILPKSKNDKFKTYDDEVDRAELEKPLASYGLQCNGGAEHRTYYDGTHARYQRGLRSGDPAHIRAAHDEAIWYRANEVEWVGSGKKLAITKCEKVEAEKQGITEPWTPDSRPLDWSTLRMMTGQGMLDDYLITGDPAAKETLVGFGEAYIANLPQLEPKTLELTERNLGWPIMGVVSYYAVDASERVRNAAEGLVSRAFAWQNRGTSGGLEHDINRPDPNECYGGDEDPQAGPKGASPFMTSLVVDGVMDWWLLTSDARVKPFMAKLAKWYEKDAIAKMPAEQGGKPAFQYLWGCKKYEYNPAKPGGDPDGFTSPELNILIGHTFGAAYAVTKDKHWIEFGDKMAEAAFEYMYLGSPKAWNQQNRSFGKYLGYRALDL